SYPDDYCMLSRAESAYHTSMRAAIGWVWNENLRLCCGACHSRPYSALRSHSTRSISPHGALLARAIKWGYSVQCIVCRVALRREGSVRVPYIHTVPYDESDGMLR